ncbi:phage major capsid protein [Cellulophaga phage phi18:2]|uniref:Phage major capsid protein n=2 Tax=Cellulophaga phage phi18:1 TaxID=1327982 RepID=S0A310_9CAUD|nr:phage major capsid protein [Cellulophaga phage phi18:1]AGO48496.1 phage major capsid protein [Cellulophaga phage phi18:1]AGO49210.1 phage major capsid protein [Cellulophaga phage phi18:2]
MDHKDIVLAIEEGTKTLKKDFDAKRQEDGLAFDKKVNDAIEALKATSLKDMQTKEAVEKAINATKEELQKNFDQFAAKHKNGSKAPEGKSFRKALHNAIGENIEGMKAIGTNGPMVMSLKDIGFEDFNGYEIFTRDTQNRVIPMKEEAFHMRQILGSGSTMGNEVYYPKAVAKTGTGPNTWDYDKTAIEDTVDKPNFGFTFDNVSAKVKWIAGILRIPKEMLSDLAWMQSYISTWAPIELLKAEDAQLLNGDGIGNNISGIIPNASSYVASNSAYTGIERIIDAAYAQMAVNNQDTPTDVLLSPRDVVSIILNKASGSGEFNLPNGVVGVVNGQLQIAGLSVQKTNKITQGNFLVGDFQRGAALVNREAPTLRAFEQDVDNVSKNMITFRIEERIALPIFYDEAFVKGTLVSGT